MKPFLTNNLKPAGLAIEHEMRANVFRRLAAASKTRTVLCFFLAASAVAQTKPDPEQGNEIFDEQCRSCHYSDSIERKVGPGLKWLFSKDKLDSNGKPVTDASVLEKINVGGKTMPAYKDTLSEEDKLNLLAFLKTL